MFEKRQTNTVANQDNINILTMSHWVEWDAFRENIREVWEVCSVDG